MFDKNITEISTRLEDKRAKKIIFAAHCILNENVRVQAGAFRKGPINEIVDELQENDIGIVQMKCPEQKAWGGVLRTHLWQPVGTKGSLQYRFMPLILPTFVWYTRRIWKRIARETVSEMKDYVNSGYEIMGVIGISASPSCGINTTFDLKGAFEWISGVEVKEIELSKMRKQYFEQLTIPGKGMYIDELQKEMRKQGIKAKFYEHDLKADLEGEPVKLLF